MDIKSKLSLLWIFYSLNNAFGDITTLYYSVFINPTPKVHYRQSLLLSVGLLVEIPIVMIVLSRILKNRINQWVNIITSIFLAFVVAASLFVGDPTLVYLFFSIILITTSVVIAWYAWKLRSFDKYS